MQQSIIVADAHYRKYRASPDTVRLGSEEQFVSQDQIDELLKNIKTEADMVNYFESLKPE